MIKFFRKIRRRFLAEGKIANYLEYAAGEIILVVAGILIALQINNWNEDQKSKSSEIVYYQKVLENLELEKALIDSLSKQANQRIEVSKQILLDLDSGIKDKNYILNQFLRSIRGHIYVSTNVTFQDLVSSGNVHLLTGNMNSLQDLRKKELILKYLQDLKRVEGILQKNSTNFVDDSYASTYNEIGYFSMKSMEEFKSLYSEFKLSEDLYAHSERRMKLSRDLISDEKNYNL